MDDVIYLDSPVVNGAAESPTSEDHYLVYFISGNPGLISYYTKFMSHLHKQLQSHHKHARFTISGRSLHGFEVQEKSRIEGKEPPYSLNEVIELAEKSLQDHAGKASSQLDGKKPKVILAGHSVGAYILLELIRRHRSRLAETGSHAEDETRIVGGICLFPTVADLPSSKRGAILNALARFHYASAVAMLILTLFASLLPASLSTSLVQLFTGMPPDSTTITAAFIKSPHGVRQSLHLGLDEVKQITTDKWDAEIWGAAHPSPVGRRPKLFFYFGENDHWVADRTRDDLIRIRGRGKHGGEEEWRPKMEVDGKGIPHAFSIRHGIPIAEKVAEYVGEIVQCERLWDRTRTGHTSGLRTI
ncbi:hypothetical protein P152DRAFT_42715 [Eremomyces bilateralis CBS 781.70]|uniref:Uncharacterized protein n=1 Tax=Eremomyces bilateralis CBS 781.70 TaxID=1392243 RepID=A0A6G1G285_9PEZI|nr:uncharacterized protein P152DRAFT_42715 [Eremomyces bilateralis CBS 781.70]KAF1812036.1 hypothetical protein P152DRAFT_42715 [Eremomyces bilateralis CBS 781.70]